MPVTARLSKELYDRLGENVAQELVEWFNSVDATYRGDLREFNELNFARFDSRLEQRLAEFEVRLDRRMAALESKMEHQVAEFQSKMEHQMLEFQSKMEHRMAEFESKMERRMVALEKEVALLRSEFAALRLDFAALRVEFADFKRSVDHALLVQTRWYLATWVVQMLMLAGILATLAR